MPSIRGVGSVRPAHALYALAAPRRPGPGIRACAHHSGRAQPTPHPNQLHAAQQTTTTPDFLIASRHQSIAHFDAQIEYLCRQVLDLTAHGG